MKTFEQFNDLSKEQEIKKRIYEVINYCKLNGWTKSIENKITEQMPFSKNDCQNFLNANSPNLYDKLGDWKKDTELRVSNGVKEYEPAATKFLDYYFLKIIKEAFGDNKKLKLCDLGCGIGNVIYFSEKLCYDSMGVEKLDIFKEIYKKYNLNVIVGDLLEIDLSFLNDIDVVYMYRPISDIDKLNYLVDKVSNNMKSNSILYFNFAPGVKFQKFELMVDFWSSKILVKK